MRLSDGSEVGVVPPEMMERLQGAARRPDPGARSAAPWVVLAVGGGLGLLVWALTGELGDAFAGGGTFAAVSAVLMQAQELQLQRRELAETREEMRKQREASEQSAEIAEQRQQIDRESLAVARLQAAMQLELATRGQYNQPPKLHSGHRLTRFGILSAAAGIPDLRDLSQISDWKTGEPLGTHGAVPYIERGEDGRWHWRLEHDGQVVDKGDEADEGSAYGAAERAIARAESHLKPWPRTDGG